MSSPLNIHIRYNTCIHIDGELKVNGDETLDLAFFPPGDVLPLFTKQHEHALQDWLLKRQGVFR